jgi:lipoyl-dependent peroxiredoxin subunit D
MLDQIRAEIPEPAKDIRLNLGSLLVSPEMSSPLSPVQRWGVAAAAAIAARNPRLAAAVLADAREVAGEAAVDDAIAAAALMGMNNVYYRFRHMIGNPSYSDKPARLRMTRLARPATSKVDFELMCLAVSAVNACETCMKAHERVVLESGLTEEHVHDAVRIAASLAAAAVALEAGALTARA